MKTTQVKYQSLKVKLTQFGLDPRDWKLTEKGRNRWVIQNQLQRDLQLEGLAVRRKESWDWHMIEFCTAI